jgi:hypothetical protein
VRKLKQQVFGPPPHGLQDLSGQDFSQIGRDWLAHPVLAHHHPAHGSAFDMRRHAATGCFNFG